MLERYPSKEDPRYQVLLQAAVEGRAVFNQYVLPDGPTTNVDGSGL